MKKIENKDLAEVNTTVKIKKPRLLKEPPPEIAGLLREDVPTPSECDLINLRQNKAPEDPEDYKILLHHILSQAMDDYIKLQHPKFRSKKYLQEAFNSAVDLLFDSNYRFLYLKNEMGEEMSLKDMVAFLLDNNRIEIDRLKQHVIDSSRKFWETKIIHTLYIPATFVYDGHVYIVHHTDDSPDSIDFDNKKIILNQRRTSESEERFMQLALQVALHHEELKVDNEMAKKIGKAIFKMLKINSCFTGD